jgi:hypothetical protein
MLLRRLSDWGSQWQGAPNSPAGYVAWNNLNLSNCCLQIDDETKVIKEITNKILKSLPISLCRPKRNKVPMTYWGLILNLRWVQGLNRDNVPCLMRMPDITMLIPLNCGLYQDDTF